MQIISVCVTKDYANATAKSYSWSHYRAYLDVEEGSDEEEELEDSDDVQQDYNSDGCYEGTFVIYDDTHPESSVALYFTSRSTI